MFRNRFFGCLLTAIYSPLDAIDAIFEKFDSRFFGSMYKRFRLDSGVILIVRLSRTGTPSMLDFRRDQSIFNRLDANDRLRSVRVDIPSDCWTGICHFIDTGETKLLPRRLWFNERQARLQSVHDGVGFSIRVDDLVEIRRIMTSIDLGGGVK